MTVETLTSSLGLSLLAALLALDSTSLVQVMVSQPLVSCAVLGWAAGEPGAGLAMGTSFQLLFASDLPVGSHTPRDAALTSMGALAAALTFARAEGVRPGPDALAASALLAVAAEPLVSSTCRLVRLSNSYLVPPVRALLARGRWPGALLLAQGGVLVFFLRGFLAVLAMAVAGSWLVAALMDRLPAQSMAALRWSFAIFPLVGAAHFLGSLGTGGLRRYADAARKLELLIPGRRSS